MLCNLKFSVGVNLPGSFSCEKEGHAATDTPLTYGPLESSERDASIAPTFT
eukprot:COSAG01_NODE_41594_length_449_cov_1.788571_1_plen_50_part_10